MVRLWLLPCPTFRTELWDPPVGLLWWHCIKTQDRYTTNCHSHSEGWVWGDWQSPGLMVRSTCLLIYCSCWRENWVRRFSFHGILGPGSTLMPLLTLSHRQESNNAVKWCHGLKGFLLPPSFCAQTVSKQHLRACSEVCVGIHTPVALCTFSPAPCECLR